MRTCIKCGDCKKDTSFYKRKDRESGFFNTCKDCYSFWRKEKYSKQIDKEKEYNEKRKFTFERRFQKLKSRAKKKNFTLTLTLNEYESVASNPCYYCNNRLGEPVLVSIGLDRLDSTKGYELNNVVSCCEFCNTTKNKNITSEEMKLIADLLIKKRSIHPINSLRS